uniref:Transmembrane 9 superfamily member n=1 Tax=Oryza punctata TaxID=4537 RepID=A0A0E0LWF4_ORYPU
MAVGRGETGGGGGESWERVSNPPRRKGRILERFSLNVNESLYLCTRKGLNENDAKLLKQRTRDLYQVNMILDNLPVMRFTEQNGVTVQWIGFLVGYTPAGISEDYIINNLKFKVLVHEYEGRNVEIIGSREEGSGVISEFNKKGMSGYQIVGFEVVPCSVKRDAEVFSKRNMYDNIEPVSCPMELQKSQVIRQQERITFTYDVEFVKSDIKWPSRWDAYLKMEAGAKVHWFSIMNSLMVIQFLDGIVFVIFLRTVRRDLTSIKRNASLTGMIILYLFLGIAAGYVSVRLWKTIKGTSEGWRSVSWLTACFFPGVLLMVLTVLNFVLWGSKSTGALPISLFFALLAMWFSMSVPLTLVGGFVGTRSAQIEFPVRTNQIPRDIPARKYPSWLLVFGAGTLPFGTLFIELFSILSSIWLGRFYYVSVVLTYMNLCVEHWRWWWKAFFASGSVAIYVFLYSINYLVLDLRSLSGPVSAMLYLGYSFLMAFSIMLATGTIGFLTSFSFVHYLFTSVKID